MGVLSRLKFQLTHPRRIVTLRTDLRRVASGDRDLETFHRLVDAWGNPWSADARLLKTIAEVIDDTEGPILDLGSGLTTALITALTRRSRRPFTCFEHSGDWYVLAKLDMGLLGYIPTHIQHTPLRTYDGFAWYDVAGKNLQERYTVVVCDGPPGGIEGGRYGALPVLGERLRGGTIIMDDAERDSTVLKRWVDDFSVSVELTEQDERSKGFALIRVPN